MKEEKYHRLIARLLSGEIEAEERQVLQQWVASDVRNQKILDEAKQLWRISKVYESDFQADIPTAWQQVAARIAPPASTGVSSKKTVVLSRYRQLWKVAAVFLIFLMVSFWMLIQPEAPLLSYQTEDEETLTIWLPDSTQVVLNENSELTYTLNDKKRMVTLAGEAWFDVAHLPEVPFSIRSGNTLTTVLGTAFNLRAYPAEEVVEVSVERGKVAFAAIKKKDKSSAVLVAGTEGVFYKNQEEIVKIKKTSNNANAWRTLKIEFDNIKLDKIFQTLERYFEVRFVTKDPTILNCGLVGNYDNPQLDELIEYMSAALDLKFEKEGITYRVTGKGCQPSN